MSMLPEVLVTLKANITDFSEKMGRAHAEVTKAGERGSAGFLGLGKAGTAAFMGLGAAAVGFGAMAVKAAMEGEQAHARLKGAVEATGTPFKAVQREVEETSKRMERFGFTNHEVEGALGTLTAGLGSPTKAMADMGLAADVAKFKHISLSESADMLVKAHAGATRAFKQFGIEVEKNADGTKNLTKAFAELHQKVGGQAAAAADTFAGRLAATKASVENLTERIGMMLLPTIERMATMLGTVAGFLGQHRELLLVIGGVIGSVVVPALLAWAAAQARAFAVALFANLQVLLGMLRQLPIAIFNAMVSDQAFTLQLEENAVAAAGASTANRGLAGSMGLVGAAATAVAGSVMFFMWQIGRTKAAQGEWDRSVVDGASTQTEAMDRLKAKQAQLKAAYEEVPHWGFISLTNEGAKAYNQYKQVTGDIKKLQGEIDKGFRDFTVSRVTDELGAMKDSLKEADHRARDLKEAFDFLNGVNISATEAAIHYNEKVRELSKSFREHGRSIDISTEAGLKNTQAILDTVTAAQKEIEAADRQGQSKAQLTALYNDQRAELVRVVTQMGVAGTAAETLMQQYFKLPEHLTTTVEANVSGALAGLNAVIAKLNALGDQIPAGDIKYAIGNARLMAAGGFVSSPTAAIVGEAGPELVLPLKDRKRSLDLLMASGLFTASSGPDGPTTASSSERQGGQLVQNITVNGITDHHHLARAVAAEAAWALKTA